MGNVVFYYHSGSFNHGCEALCRSIKKILKNNKCLVYSFNKKEDLDCGLNKILEIKTFLIQL